MKLFANLFQQAVAVVRHDVITNGESPALFSASGDGGGCVRARALAHRRLPPRARNPCAAHAHSRTVSCAHRRTQTRTRTPGHPDPDPDTGTDTDTDTDAPYAGRKTLQHKRFSSVVLNARAQQRCVYRRVAGLLQRAERLDERLWVAVTVPLPFPAGCSSGARGAVALGCARARCSQSVRWCARSRLQSWCSLCLKVTLAHTKHGRRTEGPEFTWHAIQMRTAAVASLAHRMRGAWCAVVGVVVVGGRLLAASVSLSTGCQF